MRGALIQARGPLRLVRELVAAAARCQSITPSADGHLLRLHHHKSERKYHPDGKEEKPEEVGEGEIMYNHGEKKPPALGTYRRKEALSCSLKDDIGYQKPELAKIEDTKAREKRRREERKFSRLC